MLKIGLTGSIGSGKTTIANIFKTFDVPVFYADDVAKKLYQKKSIKIKVIGIFGTKVYFTNGDLNRKYLAEQVFNNKDLLAKLNKIIHPAVLCAFEEWCAQFNNQPYVIHEAAILFETGYFKKMDFTILVTAPEEIRIGRVMQRDNVDQDVVKHRILNQGKDTDKIAKANYVIINNDIIAVIPQVIHIHQDLLKMHKK